MSRLKTKVGQWSFQWKTAPRGRSGKAEVEIQPGKWIEVSWVRDADGIIIQFPDGIQGFDLQGELDDNSRLIYRVSQRGSSEEWKGIFSSSGDEALQNVGRASQNKATRVRAQMPGKMIRILVEVGQVVQKDQPLAVMEAMKMENEIRASQAGKVSQVKVSQGQAVETGADLILLEPV
jgi:biotin carboxyl carrier protein